MVAIHRQFFIWVLQPPVDNCTRDTLLRFSAQKFEVSRMAHSLLTNYVTINLDGQRAQWKLAGISMAHILLQFITIFQIWGYIYRSCKFIGTLKIYIWYSYLDQKLDNRYRVHIYLWRVSTVQHPRTYLK